MRKRLGPPGSNGEGFREEGESNGKSFEQKGKEIGESFEREFRP